MQPRAAETARPGSQWNAPAPSRPVSNVAASAAAHPFPELRATVHAAFPAAADRLDTALAIVAPRSGTGEPRSGLNWDGSPVQLAISARAGGCAVRLVGDPGAAITTPAIRAARGRDALERLLASSGVDDIVATTCRRALAACAPRDAASARWARGLLWLGAGLDGAGAALWVDVSPWPDSWTVAEDAVRALLPVPDAALATIARVRRTGQVTSVAVEGVDASDARVKLYWQPARLGSLDELGTQAHARPPFPDFVARVMRGGRLRLTGLHLAAGFGVTDGAACDVKLDVCACPRCLGAPAGAWATALAELARDHDLRVAPLLDAVARERMEVAVVGLGVRCDGASRLNVYLKEPHA
jgi:hypothetical protein